MPSHIDRVGRVMRDGALLDDSRNITHTSTAGLASTTVGGAIDELASSVTTASTGLAAAQTDIARLERREFAFNLTATPRAGATTTDLSLSAVDIEGNAATPSIAAGITLRKATGALHTGCAFTTQGGAGAVLAIGGNNAGTQGFALVTLASGHGTISIVTAGSAGTVHVFAELLKAGSGAQVAGVTRYVSTTV